MLLVLAFSPTLVIWYLMTFSAYPLPLFENHLFHECAIAIATLEGGFISYASWKSYQASGEIFQRWLTVGLLAFTLIYTPHGLLTRAAHHNIWLFLLYGPVSRLAMLGCLVYGLTQYGKDTESPETIAQSGFWRNLLLLCAVVVVAVAVVANSPIASSPWLRLSMEAGAALLSLAGALAVLQRKIRSPLMHYYAMGLALFAQASIAFMLAKPWNHLWWFAHLVFAAGFSVIGWGVARAYLTTRSFALAYSEEQLMRALEQDKVRLDKMVDALQRSDAQLKSIFNASPDTCLITNAEGKIMMVNQQVSALLGYAASELIGESVGILVPTGLRADHANHYASFFSTANRRQMGCGADVKALCKDGSELPVEINLSKIEAGQNSLVACVVRDISDRQRMENELRNLAYYDPLTQLPNRRLLFERLKQALRVSQRNQSYGALLFLDLNKFKQLNDAYGHETGDELLVEVAQRLRGITRATDTVARLGGDEFVVLLEDIGPNDATASECAAQLVNKISQSLSEPYGIEGIWYHISASIGVSLFVGDNADADQIIKDADAAMYEVKRGRES